MVGGSGLVAIPMVSRERLDIIARGLSVVSLTALIFVVFKLFRGADSPFLAFSVIGATVVHFNRLRYAEISLTVLLAFVLALAYGGAISSVVGVLSFLGLSSMLVLGWKACRSTPALNEFLLAAFCPLLVIVTNFALAATSQFQPQVFDLFLYRIDGVLFGFQPSFVMGQWFASFPLLQDVCSIVYSALPLAQVLVFVAFIREKKRMPFNPLVVFCVAGVVGFLLYQVCPAIGPKQLFGASYPQHPTFLQLKVKVITVDSGFVRNAMPSLHTAWVLLIWWSVRYFHRWIRYVVTLFVLLTLLATLGLGEHYLIDLIAAVPFAMLIIWCCTFSSSSCKMENRV